MDLTLIELHLDDATLNAPFGTDTNGKSSTSPTRENEQDRSSSRIDTNLRPLLGVAIVIGLVILSRKLRAGGERKVEADDITIEEN